jgi:hypothetical protein
VLTRGQLTIGSIALSDATPTGHVVGEAENINASSGWQSILISPCTAI